MRRLTRMGMTLFVSAALTTPLAAQSGAPATLAFSALNGAAAARLTPDRLAEAPHSIEWMASNHSTRSEGTALMIVGAAGIILGLIIDEPIVTVAGAVTGGIGLYLYLRHGGEIKVKAE